MSEDTRKRLAILFAVIALFFGVIILFKDISDDEPWDIEEYRQSIQNPAVLAKDFEMYDFDGNKHTFFDYYGEPVILKFWTSWSQQSLDEMELFEQMYEEYSDKITFIMVSLVDGEQETLDMARACVEEHDYPFLMYYDETLESGLAYGVHSVPHTFFFNREGRAVAQIMGGASMENLQNGIDIMFEDEIEP